MKRLLIFSLLFSAFFATAQTTDRVAAEKRVDSLLLIAQSLIEQSEFEAALDQISIAEAFIVAQPFDTVSRVYGNVYYHRGLVYFQQDQYPEAEIWWQKVRSIWKKVFGEESREYIKSMNNLAVINMRLDSLDTAESLFLEVKTLWETRQDTADANYSQCLINLALVYYNGGNYKSAEPLNLRAKAIREKFQGKENPGYANCINNLAIMYQDMGQYEKSEPLHLEAMHIREKLYGPESADFAQSLNNLSSLYSELGDFEKVEPLLLRARTIYGNILGKEDPDYALSLNNLAVLYSQMGNFEYAEPLLIEANAIWAKAWGKMHPDYALGLINLGGFYLDMGQYDKAEACYLEAKTIRAVDPGMNHPDYAWNMNTLGGLYQVMGQYDKAEAYYLEANTIYEKVLDADHPSYALNLGNLGNLYLDMKLYDKALACILKANTILEQALGKESPDYAVCIGDLAKLYSTTGQYEKAGKAFEENARLNRRLLTQAVRYLSEQELNRYAQSFSESQAPVLSLVQRAGANPSGISKIAYDNSLFYKGFLLNARNQIKRITLTDARFAARINELKSLERRLAKEYVMPVAERNTDVIAELESTVSDLEKELARSTTSYGMAMQQVNWRQVQQALKPGEAAIEFVHFRWHTGNTTDSVLYGALLLLPGDTIPHYRHLFEEKQLIRILEKTGGNAAASTALYASAPAGKRQTTRSGELLEPSPAYGAELYNLIWHPLEKVLDAFSRNNSQQGRIKTVYFSPSGLLHRVSFAALPTNRKKVLCDRYILHQPGSTRSLVVKTPESQVKDYTADIFGGVQYDRNTTVMNMDSNFEVLPDNRLWSRIRTARSGGEEGFEYLPGTAAEVAYIDSTLRAQHLRVYTHTGDQATEEILKALGRDTLKSPDILHIATHGFFFPDPEQHKTLRSSEENAFKWNENPLFRSGIVLAGANQTWKGEPMPGNMEDGIATAYEISHLNLSNTKLVVLSACETGLGDIQGSEGVYGLQRAFKMAGVNYLMVSLWKVPDQETSEFMDMFYKSWLGGKTIHEAFAKAQQQMRKKYKEAYLWGAWILIE